MTCLTLPPQGQKGGRPECVATSRVGPAYALDRRTQQGETCNEECNVNHVLRIYACAAPPG